MTTQKKFKVFVSAVTADFGEERRAIKTALEKEGFAVYEQDDLINDGQSSLLDHLFRELDACDLVLCLVGPSSGKLLHKDEIPQSSNILPDEFEAASVTQLEYFRARQYHVRRHVLTRPALFDRFEDDVHQRRLDEAQKKFIQFVSNDGLVRESYDVEPNSDPNSDSHIVRKALEIVVSAWRLKQQKTDRSDCPIQSHLKWLKRFSINRLRATAALDDVPEGHSQEGVSALFLARKGDTGIGTEFDLPEQFKRIVSRHAGTAGNGSVEYLIGAGAGGGKTTLVHQLLAQLADPDFANAKNSVPLLADCILLHDLVQKEGKNWIDAWLRIAVAPKQAPGTEENSDQQAVQAFLDKVDEEGRNIILVIDGLEELLTEQIHGFLNDLLDWAAKKGSRKPLRIATYRCNDVRATNDFYLSTTRGLGFTAIELQEIGRDETREIARVLLASKTNPPDDELLDRFASLFIENNFKAKPFYLRPLVTFFRNHADLARKGHVSNVKLLEIEREHITQRICEQLGEVMQARRGTVFDHCSPKLRDQIDHVQLEIALNSLNGRGEDDKTPKRLNNSALLSLPSVKAIDGLDELLTPEHLVNRLLHILHFESRDAENRGEGLYRLPHTEYRDYLIADGLYRLVNKVDGWEQINHSGERFIGKMVEAYRNNPRIEELLKQKLCEQFDEKLLPMG